MCLTRNHQDTHVAMQAHAVTALIAEEHQDWLSNLPPGCTLQSIEDHTVFMEAVDASDSHEEA